MLDYSKEVEPMPLEIRQLHDLFGAELVGVNATKPLTEADFVPIRDAFETYSVLLFADPSSPTTSRSP